MREGLVIQPLGRTFQSPGDLWDAGRICRSLRATSASPWKRKPGVRFCTKDLQAYLMIKSIQF